MAKLSRPDPSDPLYAREARNRVRSAWRRFTFDEHLRNGCRVLIPLLEFYGKDLADSKGVKTSEKLSALAEIEVVIESVARG